MYNTKAYPVSFLNPADFYISALSGRLCQKDFRMDFGLDKPQPSIFSRRIK